MCGFFDSISGEAYEANIGKNMDAAWLESVLGS
jgi:hypothetical protein